MRKFWIILFLIFVVFPAHKIEAQSSNAGFVQGNIWYSKDPFEEGVKIKIYTMIFNPDSRELSGTVTFFDKTTFLGKKNFIAPAKSVKDVSIDWTATVGDHAIFGKIENAKFLISVGKYEDVYLLGNETEQSKRTVNKKIIIQPAETIKTNTDSGIGDIVFQQVQNVEKLIKENMPNAITAPFNLATNTVEKWRNSIGLTIANKKEEVKKEIEILNNTKIPSNPKITDVIVKENQLIKPFKNVELFALTLSSVVFNNKFIFYGLLALIFFFLIRYLWRLIF